VHALLFDSSIFNKIVYFMLASFLLVLSLPFRIKESCPLMTCALRLAAGRPGLVLDVGANGGCESNLALMAGRKVIAVECLASAYWELLQEPRFRSHPNLTLLHTCAGAVVNITTLYLASDSSSLMEENVAHGVEAGKAKKSRKANANMRAESEVIVPLDLLVPAAEPVALIKIDVQGAEAGVLRGLRRTLARHLPIVTFEYISHHPGYREKWSTNGNPAHDQLEPLGYACYIDFVDYICLPPGYINDSAGPDSTRSRDRNRMRHAEHGEGASSRNESVHQFPCLRDRRGLYA
jgi:FkbM family methyltransferase